MPVRRARIVVALDPPVLESAVAHLLRHTDVDDVVEASLEAGAVDADIAVVDRRRADVEADLIIHLRASRPDGSVVDVTGPGATIEVHGLPALLQVLDGLRPRHRRRTEALSAD